jgi:hypothetical protein
MRLLYLYLYVWLASNFKIIPLRPQRRGTVLFLIFVFFYVFLLFYVMFCVVLCIVCVYMCTELLPPGGYPVAVK